MLSTAYRVIGDFDPFDRLAWPWRVLSIFAGVVIAWTVVPSVVRQMNGDSALASGASFAAFTLVMLLIARQLAHVHWPSADSDRLRSLSFLYRLGILVMGAILLAVSRASG